MGNQIILKDSKGNLVDHQGKKVNQKGYLIDNDGNVISKQGKIMFEKILLENDGDIP